MAASVANQAAAAGVAVGTVVLCFVQFTGLYRYSDRVSQVEVLGLADEIKSSLEGLFGLFLFAAKAVMMPVLAAKLEPISIKEKDTFALWHS